jgi:hypothetical protein
MSSPGSVTLWIDQLKAGDLVHFEAIEAMYESRDARALEPLKKLLAVPLLLAIHIFPIVFQRPSKGSRLMKRRRSLVNGVNDVKHPRTSGCN